VFCFHRLVVEAFGFGEGTFDQVLWDTVIDDDEEASFLKCVVELWCDLMRAREAIFQWCQIDQGDFSLHAILSVSPIKIVRPCRSADKRLKLWLRI